jgi:hypothetical protein
LLKGLVNGMKKSENLIEVSWAWKGKDEGVKRRRKGRFVLTFDSSSTTGYIAFAEGRRRRCYI